MNWWGYLIIVVITISCVPICNYFYKKGKKKGADDLLQLFLVNGYIQKVASFMEQNKSSLPGGVVFVGDSITQDFPVQDYFPGLIVYNRGIGGDTTVGVLKRLNESVFELKPSIVVLLIGTNDFGVLNAKPEEVFIRCEEIVNQIKKFNPNTQIILQSVYPVNPTLDAFSVASRNNLSIKTLNHMLENIKGCTYLNLFDRLADETGNLNPVYTLEGLHINQFGYRLISCVLKELFDKIKAASS